MELGVLGPVQARLDERLVELGTPKQRALVASLALWPGRPVSVDTITDLLWGDDPPPGVAGTLQAYVSGLRRVLEPDRARRAPATVLVTVAPGYALRLSDGDLDAAVFERAVDEQHRRLQLLEGRGAPLLSGHELGDAVERLDEAVGLWRGTPYAELGDAPAAVAERARLDELRLVALEDRVVAGLALGRHRTVVGDLEAMTAEHPLRERLWALRALALTRSGRQADALEVLRQVRQVLDDDLGLEPGPELRELQSAILRQDPALDWVAPPELSPTPVVVSGPTRPEVPVEAGPGWPLVGRDDELVAMQAALDRADGGSPTFVALTGEPGIGKSRLAAELVSRARARGAGVAVGRCTQDDVAPPLWPWSQVLQAMGSALSGEGDTDEGARFRVWEQIVRDVTDAARDRLWVVGLDDLHWADPSTLRVLRLLATPTEAGRLLVVTTWREHPPPTGALADAVEALARAHAVRLSLTGLASAAVQEIFATVAHNRPSDDQASALRERTDGNPFFVVEYARLAGERADLGRLVSDEPPPTGVQEVLTRRLTRLPDATVEALRTASVIGREFDTVTLARAAGIDEDDVLDLVEPAEAAGLVRDAGVERFVFGHALVRDTLVASLGATRRARAHAKVAAALSGSPHRVTEEAQHWLAAGPAHAARAWRSAVDASEAVRGLHDHERASELLEQAAGALADDPDASPRDRYDLLMRQIDAYRWSAQWPELTATVEAAVEVARGMGDPELVARAAISTSQGALWQSAPPGQVHEPIVSALRTCLDDLPDGPGALRCRVLMCLANELYYGSAFEERRDLIAEASAMARALDDDELLLDACQLGFSALWVARTAEERLALVDESLVLARRTGNERGYVVSACLRAVVLAELGRPGEMWAASEVARAEAERLRIPFGVLVLDSLVLPWLAMAGRFDECAELVDRIRRVESQVSLEESEDATGGALAALAVWQGGSAEAAGFLAEMEGGPFPVSSTVVAYLWRGGEEEQARAYWAEHPVDLGTDDWFSLLAWCMAAEDALHLGDASLGAQLHERLSPLAGRSAGAGSSNASGPVDAFLAMAAAAGGDRAAATRHADEAARLCVEWEIPLAGDWLRRERERFGF